jgi:hypothetical protein
MARRFRSWLIPALGLLAAFAVSTPAAGAGPVIQPIEESFVDINPCTGEQHTVFVTGTFFEFDRANGIGYRIDRVVTTSSGFTGGGTEVGIHDRIFKVTDRLANAEGDILLANAVLVVDPSGTVHVESFDLTCRSRP